MNILTQEELNKNCKDNLIIYLFFKQEEYLKSLINEKYCDLDLQNRNKVDIILSNMSFTLDNLLDAIRSNYYIKKRFILYLNLFGCFIKDEFKVRLNEFYFTIEKYITIIDEIQQVYEIPEDKLDMYDIFLAHQLIYLLFVSMINDLKEGDLSLLNKNNYKDSDVCDFKYVKKEISYCFISLKNRNKKRTV